LSASSSLPSALSYFLLSSSSFFFLSSINSYFLESSSSSFNLYFSASTLDFMSLYFPFTADALGAIGGSYNTGTDLFLILANPAIYKANQIPDCNIIRAVNE
jgi:hypothetical protein